MGFAGSGGGPADPLGPPPASGSCRRSSCLPRVLIETESDDDESAPPLTLERGYIQPTVGPQPDSCEHSNCRILLDHAKQKIRQHWLPDHLRGHTPPHAAQAHAGPWFSLEVPPPRTACRDQQRIPIEHVAHRSGVGPPGLAARESQEHQLAAHDSVEGCRQDKPNERAGITCRTLQGSTQSHLCWLLACLVDETHGLGHS